MSSKPDKSGITYKDQWGNHFITDANGLAMKVELELDLPWFGNTHIVSIPGPNDTDPVKPPYIGIDHDWYLKKAQEVFNDYFEFLNLEK